MVWIFLKTHYCKRAQWRLGCHYLRGKALHCKLRTWMSEMRLSQEFWAPKVPLPGKVRTNIGGGSGRLRGQVLSADLAQIWWHSLRQGLGFIAVCGFRAAGFRDSPRQGLGIRSGRV